MEFVKEMERKAIHKNNYVSGKAVGWLKKVRLEIFFFHFCKKILFFPKMENIFEKKKWKKKNCGHPTGFNVSHPLHRKQTFFLWIALKQQKTNLPLAVLASTCRG